MMEDNNKPIEWIKDEKYERDEFIKILRSKTIRHKKSNMTRKEFLLVKNKEILWIKQFRMFIVYMGWKHKYIYEWLEVDKETFSKFMNGKYNKYQGGITIEKWFYIKNNCEEILFDAKERERILDEWSEGKVSYEKTIRMWLDYRGIKISYFVRMLKDIDIECKKDLKYNSVRNMLNGSVPNKKMKNLLSNHLSTIKKDIQEIINEIEHDVLDINIVIDLMRTKQ